MSNNNDNIQQILAKLNKIQAKTDLLSHIAFDVHWFDAVSNSGGEPADGIFHQIIKNQQTIINQNIRLEKYWIDYRSKNGESINP